MVIKEVIIINETKFNHTYSDLEFYIECDGVQYSDAIDPIDIEREYVETDEKIASIQTTEE